MHNFLSFSDAAKFAEVARNLVLGLGYNTSFTFWSTWIFSYLKQNTFSALGNPPVMPFSIAVFFKIFGISDFAVISTSFFYFILTLIFIFLLARKVFKSNLIGVFSTLSVGFNYDLINYAVHGASESPFIFEIVATSYLASIKKKWATIIGFLLLILMYFTRPQAFIYIAGIILFWLLNNFKVKRALIYFIGVLIVGLLVDRFVLMPQSGKYFLYSIINRGLHSSFNQTSVASNALRGAVTNFASGGTIQILKNIFYNLYNFYKLLPQIISPYLFALFVIGLFVRVKDKTESAFKVTTVLMVVVTLLVTAASIPFFRYLHPVTPLIYIVAVGTLVGIIKSQISNNKFTILISTFLILLFGVGQTLGVLILDSRFERRTHNVDKLPVYVQLSYLLRDNTNKDQTVITNLDTWGSWYGERRTVWFPLEPKQLVDPTIGKIPFDAIYLTSYLINDQNYYMGKNWRMIFENPKDPSKWTCDGCGEVAKEFALKGVYKVGSSDNYERQDASAVLLIKK
jgi:4-amino-4-deoxy-L-arabinose transferase-like glycosyltransferase